MSVKAESDQLIPGFLQRIKECNVGLEELSSLIPFEVSGRIVGRMKRE